MQDKFYQNLNIALASVLFMVVGQITRRDYHRLVLANKYKNNTVMESKKSTVIVIHNLQHIDNMEDLLKIWKVRVI